jgi:hypothetical protein
MSKSPVASWLVYLLGFCIAHVMKEIVQMQVPATPSSISDVVLGNCNDDDSHNMQTLTGVGKAIPTTFQTAMLPHTQVILKLKDTEPAQLSRDIISNINQALHNNKG